MSPHHRLWSILSLLRANFHGSEPVFAFIRSGAISAAPNYKGLSNTRLSHLVGSLKLACQPVTQIVRLMVNRLNSLRRGDAADAMGKPDPKLYRGVPS